MKGKTPKRCPYCGELLAFNKPSMDKDYHIRLEKKLKEKNIEFGFVDKKDWERRTD